MNQLINPSTIDRTIFLELLQVRRRRPRLGIGTGLLQAGYPSLQAGYPLLRTRYPSCCPANSVKALKDKINQTINPHSHSIIYHKQIRGT